jgi:hypothetical protein
MTTGCGFRILLFGLYISGIARRQAGKKLHATLCDFVIQKKRLTFANGFNRIKDKIMETVTVPFRDDLLPQTDKTESGLDKETGDKVAFITFILLCGNVQDEHARQRLRDKEWREAKTYAHRDI